MFEYLNISDVDALKSLIEKLIADADEFAADIRRKDHAITELQIKVLAAPGSAQCRHGNFLWWAS